MTKHLRPIALGLGCGLSTAFCMAGLTNRFWWIVIVTTLVTTLVTAGYMAWSGRYK